MLFCQGVAVVLGAIVWLGLRAGGRLGMYFCAELNVGVEHLVLYDAADAIELLSSEGFDACA